MSNYDEIKMLVEASRRALSGKIDKSYNNDIRKRYGLLSEQQVEKEIKITDDEETQFT